MKIGELDVSKIMLGGSEIEKIYLGTEQVYGGEPTGTFVKAASMNDWTTGVDGIPDGWTVQNAD